MHSIRPRFHAAAFILALSIAAPYNAFAEKSDALSRISIENFGQINDGYFRGAQPKGRDYQDLAAIGIKTVIDLSDDQQTEAQSVESAGMKFVRIALTTSAAPGQMRSPARATASPPGYRSRSSACSSSAVALSPAKWVKPSTHSTGRRRSGWRRACARE